MLEVVQRSFHAGYGRMEKDSPILVSITARDDGRRLDESGRVSFGSAASVADGTPRIEVHADHRYQSLLGFGCALTDAAGRVFARLGPERRKEVIAACFDQSEGNAYTLARTHINSCDFSARTYSYDDVSGDYALEHFDIGVDREALIPLIKAALEQAPELEIIASPWSPPAWMKTNGEMTGGGGLRRDCLATWAEYITRYIQAYEREGIPIWGITVQNEPLGAHRWESCQYSAEEERDFVKFYLAPRLEGDGLSHVKIIVFDHNKDVVERRARVILSDEAAARCVAGVGVHWYSGDHFSAVAAVHRRFPDKFILGTEACIEGGVELGRWDQGERYAHDIIGDLNAGAAGWIDWNVLLDKRGGPNHAANYCDAAIIADPAADRLYYQSGFYYIGHFSRYIHKGAVRLGTRVAGTRLEAVAFENPDGGRAVVVLNADGREAGFALVDGDAAASMELPGHSIATLCYPGR